VLYFSVGKVSRGEGENTGIDREKELFAVLSEPFLTGTKGYLLQHLTGKS
jgi:hypothetical protein